MNGLTLTAVKTARDTFCGKTADSLKDLIGGHIQAASQGVFFVAYLDYRVIIGRYADRNAGLCNPEDSQPLQFQYLRRLRVFEKNAELHVWRAGDAFNGRFRRDSEGDVMQRADAEQALAGTTPRFIENGRLLELTEERGSRLVLPFAEAQFPKTPERLFLKTCNYIGIIEETGQASYTDCRFAGFTDNNGQELT